MQRKKAFIGPLHRQKKIIKIKKKSDIHTENYRNNWFFITFLNTFFAQIINHLIDNTILLFIIKIFTHLIKNLNNLFYAKFHKTSHIVTSIKMEVAFLRKYTIIWRMLIGHYSSQNLMAMRTVLLRHLLAIC